MKRRIFFLFLIFAFLLCSLASCSREKEFTHCELTLVLDSSFEEKTSEEYDILLTDGEIAVSITRISFVIAPTMGFPETDTAKGFAANYMHRTEGSDTLLTYEGIPYYTYTEEYEGETFFHTFTFYRSYQAYFIVSYSVRGKDGQRQLDRILEYADAAYFNDAPDITTK